MSPLKTEIANLLAKYVRVENHMGKLVAEFWRNGGVCCPGCGVPDYNEMEAGQERREKRVRELKAKIDRDTAKNTHTN